jgi:hypothetical protein
VARLNATKQNHASKGIDQHEKKHSNNNKKTLEKRDQDGKHEHFEGRLYNNNKKKVCFIFSNKD